MKLHYFFGCILAAPSLAVWPEIGLAHGGGGHGGGGGGHAFVGGGGHAFGGFTGRGFSPGFSGTRGFSTGRFSGRGTEANKDRSGSVFKLRRIFVALPALQLIVGACFSCLVRKLESQWVYSETYESTHTTRSSRCGGYAYDKRARIVWLLQVAPSS